MLKRKLGSTLGLGLALVVLGVGFGPAALSGQQTGPLDLSLTLVNPTPTCSATIDAVNFGQFDTGSTVTQVGTITPFNLNFNCSVAVAAATATFDGGQNPTSLRQLSDGAGNLVVYFLHDTGVLITNGQTLTFALPAGAQSVPLTASLASTSLPLAIGSYTDQVTVTFTF